MAVSDLTKTCRTVRTLEMAPNSAWAPSTIPFTCPHPPQFGGSVEGLEMDHHVGSDVDHGAGELEGVERSLEQWRGKGDPGS